MENYDSVSHDGGKFRLAQLILEIICQYGAIFLWKPDNIIMHVTPADRIKGC